MHAVVPACVCVCARVFVHLIFMFICMRINVFLFYFFTESLYIMYVGGSLVLLEALSSIPPPVINGLHLERSQVR